MPDNLVDLIIVLALLLAMLDGFRRGVIALLLDLLAVVIGIGAAALLASPVGRFFGGLGLRTALQPMVGFLITLTLADTIVRAVTGWLGRLTSKIIRLGLIGSGLGGLLGLVKQSVLLILLINLLLFLPVLPKVRSAIQSSKLAPQFAIQTPLLERAFNDLVAPAIKELQSVSTIVQITDSPIEIDTPVQSLTVDKQAEQELFRLVNRERRERGLGELTWSDRLAEVGRAHSHDMWQRQFFAHVNPSGQTPFDRLDAVGIHYRAAGENLALAPTTPIAHQGLMDSPGHRANILSPDYGQLGIGSVRNGLYGVMYTQLFTD